MGPVALSAGARTFRSAARRRGERGEVGGDATFAAFAGGGGAGNATAEGVADGARVKHLRKPMTIALVSQTRSTTAAMTRGALVLCVRSVLCQ